MLKTSPLKYQMIEKMEDLTENKTEGNLVLWLDSISDP
jgi:hypothetical protein